MPMLCLEPEVSEVSRSRQDQDLKPLYEGAFIRVAHFVKKMGGNMEDTRELLQDAFLIYCEREAEEASYHSPEGYILGICRHLWYRRYEESRKVITLEDWELAIPAGDDFEPGVRETKLLKVLEFAGKRCLDLLYKFYYTKVPIHEMAGSMGYSSAHSLSAQKYKCIQKVRSILKQKAIRYGDFFE